MAVQTLAHVSDLHIGRTAADEAMATRIAATLARSGVDHVVVSGDVTHRGLRSELDRFREIFAPLESAGQLLVVPGNHDRLGDDVGDALMQGSRVEISRRGSLYLVRCDSTGPHNRSWLNGHGALGIHDLIAIDRALSAAPENAFVALMLHHHPVQLPEDHFGERISSLLGLPYTAHLSVGQDLLTILRGRCDLVLHGHRHTPAESVPFADDARPLRLFNAGSTSQLGRMRVFAYRSALLELPRWMTVDELVWKVPFRPGSAPCLTY